MFRKSISYNFQVKENTFLSDHYIAYAISWYFQRDYLRICADFNFNGGKIVISSLYFGYRYFPKYEGLTFHHFQPRTVTVTDFVATQTPLW